MLKYINGRLAVSYCELVDRSVKATELGEGIITYNQYKYINREKSSTLQLAQANAPGQPAFYFYDRLPDNVKAALCRRYPGGIYKAATSDVLSEFYTYDDMAYNYYFNHELAFSESQIKRYTANASVVQAVIRCLNDRALYQRSLGNKGRRTVNLTQIMDELKAKKKEWHHTFGSESTLRRAISRFKKEHYDGLYNRNQGNNNAAKVTEDVQVAVLRTLLRNFRNLDGQEIANEYNDVAKQAGWDEITAQTVLNYKEEWQLYADAGARGERHHKNTNNMQVKRSKPSTPLYFWTLDGWDAELMYQETRVNKDGKTITTYHNRLNIVIVLDPYCNYIVGYFIADRESIHSIKGAVRNAITHMNELFGERYFPFQLQSDNFAKKEMGSFYTKITEKYTPAAVGNAKSKVIEPFFREFNRLAKMEKNWSGHGVTARKENQPNAEFLNTTIVKHQFPDRDGAIRQLEAIVTKMRMKNMAEFVQRFNATDDKQYMTQEMYLYQLGETTGFTNRLEGSGLNVTINRTKMVFDSFDADFRLRHRNEDWTVKYDPANLEEVLVHNADGNVKYILEEKYLQPMALRDRKEGDADELQKIFDYNKALEQNIIETQTEDFEIVQGLMQNNAVIADTLGKLIITDSNGQHKKQLQSANRDQEAFKALAERQNKEDKKAAERKEELKWSNQMEYLEEKLGDFLDEL